MFDYIFILLIHLNLLIILGVSFNLTAGYLGYVNVASAALYGIGANITAILTTQYQWGFFGTLPLALLGGACLGAVVGLPSIRVRGIYYLIVSMAFQLLFFDILRNSSVTGRMVGINGIPSPVLLGFGFSSPARYWLLSLSMTFAVLLFVQWLTGSPIGRLVRGVRENETMMLSLGKHIGRVKIQVFACSGAIAAIAGSLYASHTRFINFEEFSIDTSITILMVATIGGLGRFLGPVFGAALIVLLPETYRFLSIGHSQGAVLKRIFYALMLLLILRFNPKGLIDFFDRTSKAARRIYTDS